MFYMSLIIVIFNMETVKKFKCEVCGKEFKNKSSIYSHRKTHLNYECHKCLKLFDTFEKRRAHLLIHKYQVVYQYQRTCKFVLPDGSECDKKFSDKLSLYDHRQEECAGDYPEPITYKLVVLKSDPYNSMLKRHIKSTDPMPDGYIFPSDITADSTDTDIEDDDTMTSSDVGDDFDYMPQDTDTPLEGTSRLRHVEVRQESGQHGTVPRSPESPNPPSYEESVRQSCGDSIWNLMNTMPFLYPEQ
jgi:predicted RNA-binding Zn-ribbon protein involved in translation (DUF1610 family)